jgi:hypothetical protein
MKKFYLPFIFFVFLIKLSSAQNWGIDNMRTENRDDAGLQGNAGATSGFFQTYNPINFPGAAPSWWHLLDVRHSNQNNNYAMQFAGGFFDQNLYFRKTNNNPAQSWSKVLLETDGKVAGNITIDGTIRAGIQGNYLFYNGSADIVFSFAPRGSGGRAIVHDAGNILTLNYGGDFNGGTKLGTHTYFTENDSGTSFINGGNVGIGTSDTHGYKLAVNGTIHTQEIKVDMQNWPDYVFKPSYHLPSLLEIKAFIDKNGHLPELPPESEVAKNGINLGDMNKLLVKKVEEMTLYLIQKDQKEKQQQKQIDLLGQKLESLLFQFQKKTN